ncbi:MAG: sulfite exporter TauE/SafE family protein, partial [bacterium]
MIELPFVFLSGLLGSGHCLGMCGPFALAIGAAGRG